MDYTDVFFITIISSTILFLGIYIIDNGSNWDKWIDEIDNYSCINLQSTLHEKDLNQIQTQEILKRLHTQNCYGEDKN